MKIALISSPFVEVPPKNYGGTERIIDALGNGLINLNKEVKIFAPGDSKTRIPLIPTCNNALFNDPSYTHSRDREKRTKEINKNILPKLNEFDIINIHDYDNYDLIQRVSELNIPTLISIGHATNERIREIYKNFKDKKNLFFQGLSKKQLENLDPSVPYIHNGLKQEDFEETSEKKLNYFFSIGDMKPIKAHLTAINLAKKTGIPLIIAGAPYYPESKKYFEEKVIPNIELDYSKRRRDLIHQIEKRDWKFKKGEIIYFGSASDEEKNVLYKNALFLQFLGNLEVKGNLEACPTTILEAILYGTPVLGVKNSVTEELLEEGKTGYNINSLEEALEKVGNLKNLNPLEIQNLGRKRYSSENMAKNYLKLYSEVIK